MIRFIMVILMVIPVMVYAQGKPPPQYCAVDGEIVQKLYEHYREKMVIQQYIDELVLNVYTTPTATTWTITVSKDELECMVTAGVDLIPLNQMLKQFDLEYDANS